MGKGKRLREQRAGNDVGQESKDDFFEMFKAAAAEERIKEVKKWAYVHDPECRFNITYFKANGAAWGEDSSGNMVWFNARDWDYFSTDLDDKEFILGCCWLMDDLFEPRLPEDGQPFPCKIAFEHWVNDPDTPIKFLVKYKDDEPVDIAVVDIDLIPDDSFIEEAMSYAGKRGGYVVFTSTNDNRDYPAREDIEVYPLMAKKQYQRAISEMAA